jgi:hypothetical protein
LQFGQAVRRFRSTWHSTAKLLAIALLCWLGTERLQAQDGDEAAPAKEAAQDAGVSGLEGQLTLDSGATCLERQKLISRIVRWRETENVDSSLRVQVWGDPKVATRVFFSVSRDGVDPAERTLANAPSDCDELHSAVALSIALAIDSLFASKDNTPLSAALENLEEKQADNAQPKEPPYRRFWEADLLVGATLGVVPGTAMAALPRVQVALLPWLAVAAEGIVTRAERLTFGAGPNTFDAMVLGIGLDGCFGGETAERMSFYVCAGVRGGGFSTQGYGFSSSELVTEQWWAVAGSSQARAWILPAFGIGIGIEAMFALYQRDLVAKSGQPGVADQLQPVQPFGLAVSGGPVFRFY